LTLGPHLSFESKRFLVADYRILERSVHVISAVLLMLLFRNAGVVQFSIGYFHCTQLIHSTRHKDAKRLNKLNMASRNHKTQNKRTFETMKSL